MSVACDTATVANIDFVNSSGASRHGQKKQAVDEPRHRPTEFLSLLSRITSTSRDRDAPHDSRLCRRDPSTTPDLTMIAMRDAPPIHLVRSSIYRKHLSTGAPQVAHWAAHLLAARGFIQSPIRGPCPYMMRIYIHTRTTYTCRNEVLPSSQNVH